MTLVFQGSTATPHRPDDPCQPGSERNDHHAGVGKANANIGNATRRQFAARLLSATPAAAWSPKSVIFSAALGWLQRSIVPALHLKEGS